MYKLVIKGGARLEGEVAISGAKNAALPLIAASLLADGECIWKNVPNLGDVRTMAKVLGRLGGQVSGSRTLRVDTTTVNEFEAPYELVKTMRASVLVLGPLLARSSSVRVSLPGGCAIGVRPINLHLAAFEKLGAEVRLDHGYVEAKAARLVGADIKFDTVTVTGTENVMLAATLARGTTRLVNAAREPEVVDLAHMLTGMGAKITGAGTETIVIDGVERLHGVEHAVIADRIEAGTYALAAAATRGDVAIRRCVPGHLTALTSRMAATGARIEASGDTLRVRAEGPLTSHDVATAPYPGFPTDLQAQWMALAAGMDGVATITETIFENRFQHVAELVRMGARIRLEGRWAVVEGPSRLTGARVMASDLRASAALAIAALTAEGETTIDRVYHLDRGYQRMEEKLQGLGAKVRRVKG
jgi:UDP-N-acetylglucosamine 1-carboxyvinyltransferase